MHSRLEYDTIHFSPLVFTMKNIFGQELSEELSKLYSYALSPDGGLNEALMIASANNLEQQLATVVHQDYDAVKFIYKVFYERFHISLSSFKQISENRLTSGLYEFKITPLFKWAHMVELGITACRRTGFYRFSTTPMNEICPIGRDGKYSVRAWLLWKDCYDGIIYDNIIENAKDKAQLLIQSYTTRTNNTIGKKAKLPKIDWGMVKLNITI